MRSHKAETWWPDVSNLRNAQKAIRYGFVAAVIVASVTAIVGLVTLYIHEPIMGVYGRPALFSAVLYAAIGFGIYRRSRVAAVCGLLLFLIDRLVTLTTQPLNSGGIVVAAILALYFIHGVRGTFAYRKLSDQPPATKADAISAS
jgi:hypothetical protein